MKLCNDKYEIRKVSNSDDLEKITELIRSAYKVLLDKGFRYWGTYQTSKDTAKRFSNSDAFVVEFNNEIVATITLKSNHLGKEDTPWYDKSEVCFFTQFAVKPELQKTGLGSEMMSFIEKFANNKGFLEIALDTCEEAKGLIQYYTKRGYRFVDHVQWDLNVVNYRSVVLSKNLLS